MHNFKSILDKVISTKYDQHTDLTSLHVTFKCGNVKTTKALV